ncbi:hypothetical protein MGN70_007203 [Eutypa lata]|nr:hypothetical protein MGN70_007203 [Eutypa lata]
MSLPLATPRRINNHYLIGSTSRRDSEEEDEDEDEEDMESYLESPTGHNTEFAMQKYLLLHNQHEELLQQMHDLCPSYTGSSTAVTSPSLSPTRSFSSSPPSWGSNNHRRSSRSGFGGYRNSHSTLEPVLDETLVEEMAAGQQKLSDVNEGIKRTLTELLNCDAVRKDRATRTWVQTRLLETEKELRCGRRRRSSGGSSGLD